MTFDEAKSPFELAGSTDLGILVIHGLTSTPGSMRGVAEGLNRLGGWTAHAPLLPGHGTVWTDLNKIRWQDWESTVEQAYRRLAAQTTRVAVVGLSLGGALALNLAAAHPELAGLVLINHLMFFGDFRVPLLPVLRHFIAGEAAIAGDIKAAPGTEPAYTMTPSGGVDESRKLVNQLKGKVAAIRTPVLMFKSRIDHVVPVKSATWTLERLGSERKQLVWLEDSYHVATMDNDLGRLVTESATFLRSL